MTSDSLNPSWVKEMERPEEIKGEGYRVLLILRDQQTGQDEDLYVLFTDEHYHALKDLVRRLEEDMEDVL